MIISEDDKGGDAVVNYNDCQFLREARTELPRNDDPRWRTSSQWTESVECVECVFSPKATHIVKDYD